MNGPSWVNNAVFYQIFPERFRNGDPSNDPPGTANWERDLPTRENFFGGDLAGITLSIPYLKDLGINALYLTPIFAAGSNHKYDTHNYRAIDPALGTLEIFRQMRAELKDAGIRLILDAVLNHCGDGFWAFQDVVKRGAESPYFDWFFVDGLPICFDPPSYQTCGGAPFLPKLNTNHPGLQAELLQAITQWTAEGIDGWRLDVPWKVSPDFWRRFRQCVLALNPEAYLVAEVWRGTSAWLQGDTVHGVMNYRLRQYILDYAAFDHMDAEDFDYELHQLLDEHGATTPYHLTLLSSHDTPRIRTLCGGDIRRTIIATTLQMTLPGAPMVYYGDEVGMEGSNDPDCRRPMQWDTRQWCMPIVVTARKLIHLRRTNPALRAGALRTLRIFNGVYAYARIMDDNAVIVVLNPRAAQPKLAISLEGLPRVGRWLDVLSETKFTEEDGQLIFQPLPGRCAYTLIPDSPDSRV